MGLGFRLKAGDGSLREKSTVYSYKKGPGILEQQLLCISLPLSLSAAVAVCACLTWHDIQPGSSVGTMVVVPVQMSVGSSPKYGPSRGPFLQGCRTMRGPKKGP